MRILVTAFLVAVLSGCASVQHKPIAPDAAAQLKGGSLAQANYPKADFVAMTPAAGALGLLGGAIAVSEGRAISADNELPDPARAISAGLAEKLSAIHGMQAAAAPAAPSDSDDVAALASAHAAARYLLDVKTFNWGIAYYPTKWARYRFLYGARMRLIDTASKSVIAETACRTMQGDDENPPDKDQLLADRAALLKEYADKAVRGCVDVLAREVLKL